MTTAVERSAARAGRRATDEPPEPPRRRAATPLAITSVVLGSLGTLMALGVVWFFLALPFGLVAVVCALVDRRATKRETGRSGGGLTTVGLVLGCACIPLALGALVIIPRVESLTRDSAAGLQSGVQEDLDGIEQTASQNIDKLDRTLRELVKSDNEAWSTDFDKLEKSMDEGLSRTERQLKDLLDQLERSTRGELTRLEDSARRDVADVDTRIAAVEELARSEIERLERELAELRALVEAGG